jgi:hypothetical protein
VNREVPGQPGKQAIRQRIVIVAAHCIIPTSATPARSQVGHGCHGGATFPPERQRLLRHQAGVAGRLLSPSRRTMRGGPGALSRSLPSSTVVRAEQLEGDAQQTWHRGASAAGGRPLDDVAGQISNPPRHHRALLISSQVFGVLLINEHFYPLLGASLSREMLGRAGREARKVGVAGAKPMRGGPGGCPPSLSISMGGGGAAQSDAQQTWLHNPEPSQASFTAPQ